MSDMAQTGKESSSPKKAFGLLSMVLFSVSAILVADTVGAGDAFTAGALAHLHDRKWLTHEELDGLRVEDMERLLLDANAVAADTCTRKGAEPPRRRSALGQPGPSSS